ncbi:alpha/beta hydrolase [Herbiconiux sp. VKM Ac-2851]|uniref:alpha/beta hydrolase n=1 Tax=Herbiconiux sp. VKM Ac-2851 TaxID=2739025 RepID=UPI0015651225|nr:alpha/beta hydrolase [Herbiconiux sp. VKM Ac-2851]NQX34803.1 alpha/beta hydrolase [Herbiconiux sp. VKM Ac-2851]
MATRPRRPIGRILKPVALAIATLLVAVVVGFLVDAHTTYAAELEPVQAVAADPAVDIAWTHGDVVMTPTGPANGTGLVFLAGAKVDPLAYADKLSGIVDAGTTVVIVRPILNFAIFEFRPFSTFTDLAPGVDDWYVGGHSLGGVKACQYATDADVRGLVLLGSYCAGDLSDSGIPVLSVSGSEDGLSTPAKIDASRADLPADARFVVIEGANHASFGDYGPQPGDGTASIDDERMRARLTTALDDFLAAP